MDEKCENLKKKGSRKFFTCEIDQRSCEESKKNSSNGLQLILLEEIGLFQRKLDFFKEKCPEKLENEKNHKVFSNSAELQNRPNSK